MIVRLPPEVIFHIVSFLQDDKAALSACSLCCSAMAVVTKPLLFHTLRMVLQSLSPPDRFDDILETGSAVWPLIKRINLAVPTYQPVVDRSEIVSISWMMIYIQQQGAAPELRLTTQPARRGPLSQFGRMVLPYLEPVHDWVTSLELDQVNLTGDIHIWSIILAFPKLTSLILGCVNMEKELVHISPQSEASTISHLTLRKTALDDRSNIPWLFASHTLPFPSLTSIDVRFPTALDRSSTQFGEQYGAAVTTLRFGVVIVRGPTANQNKLASPAAFISRFECLEALTFQGLLVPPVPVCRSPVTFEWIPIALERVSPTLRKLTMEVIAAHLSFLDIIPWLAIDEMLASKLQSVTIVEILLATPVGMVELLEGVYQAMRGRLPLTAQRGILRCSAVSEHPT